MAPCFFSSCVRLVEFAPASTTSPRGARVFRRIDAVVEPIRWGGRASIYRGEAHRTGTAGTRKRPRMIRRVVRHHPTMDRAEAAFGGKAMAEERMCLMTMFDGRADRQSLDELNQLLDLGWRIAGINFLPQRLPGVGNFKAFIVKLSR